MILTDTFIVENAELITEERAGKTVRRLRGIFGRCDEKNNNGRVYSKKLLEREVTNITEAMAERRLMGELDHPSHNSVKLSNVSHLITGLSFKGNELVGECELLDTPSGKVAQALVEGGVKVGISSRGMGTLSEQSDGTKTVNEDFKLVTFDLVADPSTRGAFPGLSESSQSNLVEEIVKDTLDKAAKEKVFTTILKDKLREKGEFNQAPAKLMTIPELQKKANKKATKPTAEEPFKNWEDFYGFNTGKARLPKSRTYSDADTVTAPEDVVENRYGALRSMLSEGVKDTNEFDVIRMALTESKKKRQSTRDSARKSLYAAAKGAGKTRKKKIDKDSDAARDAAMLRLQKNR
jgi:ribosome biogenesis protein Nip4